jgi:CHAD domain-containing protein
MAAQREVEQRESEHLEIETKYEVAADTVIPDLAGLAGVNHTSTDPTFHLTAVYYDTEALDLSGHRITLRRRTGGKDDGWHLKLPESDGAVGGGRREITVGLDEAPGDGVPAALTDRVLAIVRGRALSPIAIINNDRATTYLHGADDELLGEFVDDHVRSVSLLADGREQAWREWEFEIPDTDAARSAARAVDAAVRAAGAVAPDRASKLARAIDSVVPTRPRVRRGRARIGEVLVSALAEYRDNLVAADPAVRERAHDSVHQMRIACRQLRSVLSEYSQYLSGPAPAALQAELKTLAAVLGAVRDAEVVAEQFEQLAVAEPEYAGAAELIAVRQRAAEARGWRQVDAALASDRYLDLLDALDALVTDPPLNGRADRRATALAAVVHKRYRKFVARAHRVIRDPASPDHEVHEIRKKAKRLRYAGKAVALPRTVRRELRSLSEVQALLGGFQDAHIAREAIAEALPDVTDPVLAFRLGRLDALQQQRAEQARAGMPRALRHTR